MLETRSFAICVKQKEKKDQVSIKKAHINLWLFLQKKIIVDVGFQLDIKKSLLNEPLELIFYTPFLIDEQVAFEDLYTKLNNKLTMQIIFNDSVLQYCSLDENSDTDEASLIKFANKNPLILIKPKINRVNESCISIVIDPTFVRKEEIPEDSNWYIRFRYESNRYCNIFVSDNGGVNDKIYFDFRFNEPRQLPRDIIRSIQASMLEVEKLFVFMMQDLDFKLTLNEKGMEYIRFLEVDGFLEYMPELKNLKKQLLVYFWKMKLDESNPTANMVIAFEREKESIKQFRSGVFVNVFSSAILLGSDGLNKINAIYSMEWIKVIINVIHYIFIVLFISSLIYSIIALIRFSPYFFRNIFKRYWGGGKDG
ncbi:Hypothetical protein LUCI_2349 [Lucifera butyrica]|uniref:Uncharacterized protein n=1 Tax=Lucifera butyrica TaxID=1351585 RepID=A0A498R7Z8_9FIRM|nr:hypothetical protein [Lucifera butyrica]VBB07105.1 Hypothetical protein LUCI_2349 [Lucifera butyrica]